MKLDDPKIIRWREGRILHFVRHGHYESGDTGSGSLTDLGRRQAKCLSRYFADLPIAAIASSDWPRARETAAIIADTLDLATPKHHRVLREMLPTRVPGMQVPLAKRKEGSKRIELILGKFFKASRHTQHQIIVSHGNLIRALVMRIATRKLDGWYRLTVDHCGVTSFLISERGPTVVGVNAQAHVPRRLRSSA
jgi:broad specificity phosphatase PhoE